MITQITDPLERSWSYAYDEDDNLVSAKLPGGRDYSFTYDGQHNLTAIHYPDGSSKRISYDVKRDLVEEARGPGRQKTRYSYNFYAENPGELNTIVSDEYDNKTTYHFSSLPGGRKLNVTNPLGETRDRTYDMFDNLLMVTDENGDITQFTYDGKNRLTSKKDANGYVWHFEYVEDCGCDRLKQLIDPDNKGVSVSYNANLDIAAITDRSDKTIHYSYTHFGAIAKIWGRFRSPC